MRAFALLLMGTGLLLADGGIVLLHRDAGPYVVTVFASPNPPRSGTIDMSVLVQMSETLDPVLDAAVPIALTNGSSEIHALATHAQAQNKMLYAASVLLERPGDWRYTVTIDGSSVAGVIAIAPEMPKAAAYAGYLALPFFCLAILALHQWLSLNRSRLSR